MSVNVIAVGQNDITPIRMSHRFRHEIAYFGSRNGSEIPVELAISEYWVDLVEVQEIYDAGVVRIVSPLDSSTTAELELSEELEVWLEWILAHKVQHVRIE